MNNQAKRITKKLKQILSEHTEYSAEYSNIYSKVNTPFILDLNQNWKEVNRIKRATFSPQYPESIEDKMLEDIVLTVDYTRNLELYSPLRNYIAMAVNDDKLCNLSDLREYSPLIINDDTVILCNSRTYKTALTYLQSWPPEVLDRVSIRKSNFLDYEAYLQFGGERDAAIEERFSQKVLLLNKMTLEGCKYSERATLYTAKDIQGEFVIELTDKFIYTSPFSTYETKGQGQDIQTTENN